MARTILVLAANPKNTSPLRLDQEVREIDEGLRRALRREEFVLISKWAARPKDIRRAMLDYKPNIVHFCGHGSGEGGLVFEDENGQAKPVSTDALAEFFGLFAGTVECVVLNACYSEVQAEAIAKHIPYVIGMKGPIEDATAIEFAVAFYDALGAGEPFEFAYKLACNAIKWAHLPDQAAPQMKSKKQVAQVAIREFSSAEFYARLNAIEVRSVDNSRKLYNLNKDYGFYGDLIPTLLENGWVRFAAGFKAGIYAHPRHRWCIKILGMGVGDNPSYFFGRGYYLEHERNMLLDFREKGFDFPPAVMTQEETVSFLVECGVSEEQAVLRAKNNDLLVEELLVGVPFLIQTGRQLECEVDPCIMSEEVLRNIRLALEVLRFQLDDANALGLMHNDPIAFNILFTLGQGGLIARLVDFELAQNLNKASPPHVDSSVAELYRERNVPIHPHTGRYVKNLDQHLIEESIQIAEYLMAILRRLQDDIWPWPGLSFMHSFPSGIKIKLRNLIDYLSKRVDPASKFNTAQPAL